MEHSKIKYRLNQKKDIVDGKSHQFGVNVRHSGEFIFDKIHYECLFQFTVPHPLVGGT